MSNLLEHAKRELKLAGYDIDREIDEINLENDYADSCAKNAFEMLKVFSEANHSGFSSSCTLQLFHRLATFKNLTPLTNNPKEWMHLGGSSYQNRRNSSCFSDDDLKTYYDLDDENNYVIERDGESTYRKDKPREEWKRYELEEGNK